MFASARAGEFNQNKDGTVTVAGETLQPHEFVLALESPTSTTAAVLGGNDGVVVLDTLVTDTLAAEGLARDVVRYIQQARREAKLLVTQRIRLQIDGDEALLDAVRSHESQVAAQVLAVEFVYGSTELNGNWHVESHIIEGFSFSFGFIQA